jgi:hypothetical protein
MSNGAPFQNGSAASRRRSQRVILTLAVTVRTVESPKDASFEEESHTLIVNAHGALVALASKVKKGQRLLLTNRASKEAQLCRVVSFGATSENKTQVGVEFLQPSPDFWHISFPPEDWVVPEPSSTSENE